MRVGVLLLPVDPWDETVERVRGLEALGYDHVWTYDHLSWKRYRGQPWLGAIPWLTGLAMATSRLRLGTMVATPNFRHPLMFAKDAATLDHISHGRLTLGLGAGGTGFDATVFGQPILTPTQRAERLEEFVGALDRLLRDPETTHLGERYTIVDAEMRPACVQQPRVPFAIAATGRRTLALVARYGDAWVTYGDANYTDTTRDGTEAAVREQAARLDDYCQTIGRDPNELRRIYLIGNTDERPLASIDEFVAFAGRYRELGFTDLVFHHPRPGDPVWTEPEDMVERLAVEGLRQLDAL
jgi:alkanesulfonate monooxygenase SsuD/methylene tetrahydromethanopterin reductase-like flavin-dependent oxidoreductase (luciferase family)